MPDNPDTSVNVKKVLIGLTLLVAGVGWVVALGGLAKLDAECDRSGCDDLFRPTWWTLFFQLSVYFSLAIAYVTGGVPNAKLGLLVFLAIVAVRAQNAVEAGLGFRDTDEEAAGDALAAGFIMVSLADFLFIILLGCEEALEGALSRVRVNVNRAPAAEQTPPPPTAPPPSLEA